MQSNERLIVFADDWGRHPSSCQHLIRALLPRYRVLWVNSIGTRPPRATGADLRRSFTRLAEWAVPWWWRRADTTRLDVIAPLMWPGFRSERQQRFNARSVGTAVHRALARAATTPEEGRLVITTVPIAAAFIDTFPADAWLYYCVDDYAAWPGVDATAIRRLEERLLTRADAIVAASGALQQRLSTEGYSSTVITHGVDAAHWTATQPAGAGLPRWWAAAPRPIALFWGIIDQRLDVEWVRALIVGPRPAAGSIVLLGPTHSPPDGLGADNRVLMPGPAPYAALPAFAAAADVLIMPYADLPVTRSMQPLKLKEYLATGKPVVARGLPATREWADAADMVETADAFAGTVAQRAATGVPPSQRIARLRLAHESWRAKADEFDGVIRGCLDVPVPGWSPGAPVSSLRNRL